MNNLILFIIDILLNPEPMTPKKELIYYVHYKLAETLKCTIN